MRHRFLLLVFLLATGCRLADLRPAGLREREPTAQETARGRRLLRQAVDAQGGLRAWARSPSFRVRFRDEWRGLVGWLACPWPALENDVELWWRRDGSLTEARFLDGPEAGGTWRLAEGRTARIGADGTHDERQRETQRFILAAYPYLMELPFRLLRGATHVAWVGERHHDGRVFDLVLATWQSFEPHAGDDQFVLWIDRESHRVTLAQYTIRDKYRWATGADHVEDYRRAGSLLIPFRHTVSLRAWSGSFVHRIEIRAAR